MKFNQFKYSQLMFLKSIKKVPSQYRKSIFVEQEKNLKHLIFGKGGSMIQDPKNLKHTFY